MTRIWNLIFFQFSVLLTRRTRKPKTYKMVRFDDSKHMYWIWFTPLTRKLVCCINIILSSIRSVAL